MESQSLYSETPAPVADKTSVVEDFLDIFYAPRQVFERRRDGQFGLAMLILVIAVTALYFATRAVMEPFYEAMVDMQMEAARRANPGITSEQLQQGRGFAETLAPFLAIVTVPFVVLATGVTLWLVGKIYDSRQTFTQALMVSTYAQVPRFILGAIVTAISAFLVGAEGIRNVFSLSLGLARFAPDGSSMLLLQALNRVELFTIWATVLLGIGLSVTGRIPKRQAFIAAFIVWMLGSLLAVAGAARGG